MRCYKKIYLAVIFAASLGIITGLHGIAAGDESTIVPSTVAPPLTIKMPASAPVSVRPPQFEVPKAGNTVDKSFKVNLDGVAAGTRCVSIMQDQAIIRISRDLLDSLVKNKPKVAKTEEDRTEMLHGDRALILLENITSIKDDLGCDIIQSPLDSEAAYLVSALLQSGQAGVVDNETSWQKYTLYVRFKGVVVAPLMGKGDILFSFDERSHPFLTVRWWVS